MEQGSFSVFTLKDQISEGISFVKLSSRGSDLDILLIHQNVFCDHMMHLFCPPSITYFEPIFNNLLHIVNEICHNIHNHIMCITCYNGSSI